MSLPRSFLVVFVCLFMIAGLDAQRTSGRRRQRVRPVAPVYSGEVAEEVYVSGPRAGLLAKLLRTEVLE